MSRVSVGRLNTLPLCFVTVSFITDRQIPLWFLSNLTMALIKLFFVLFLINVFHQTQSQSTDALFPVRMLGFSAESIFTFDIHLALPLQIADLNLSVQLDLDLPFRIRFMNHTLEYHPIKIPYFVLPKPKPVTFDLSGGKKPHKYYDYEHDPYSYDNDLEHHDSPNYEYDYPTKRKWFPWSSKKKTQEKTEMKRRIQTKKKEDKAKDSYYYRKYENYGSRKRPSEDEIVNNEENTIDDDQPDSKENEIDDHTTDFGGFPQNVSLDTLRYYHRRHRRDVSIASVQHRVDFFEVLENTISAYGLDGRSCICRAICEMAEMEFLIETPIHEVIEHLLRVSRSYDEEGNLQDYIKAEAFGHENFRKQEYDGCSKRYSACSFSIFDRFFH